MKQVSTSQFIRDFLLEHGEGYPYQVYKALRAKLIEKGYFKRRGTYQSVLNYFYWLGRLGLVEKTREEKSERPGFKARRYYTIVKEGINSPSWINPRKTLYPSSYEKHHRAQDMV